MEEIRSAIARKLDFPQDIVLDIPKITITGKEEILIENHKGIIFFGENEVKINSGIGPVSIQGSNFQIRFIGGSTITITGCFKAVSFEVYE